MLLQPPGRPLEGQVRPPGSKSITNRALLLAALAAPPVSPLVEPLVAPLVRSASGPGVGAPRSPRGPSDLEAVQDLLIGGEGAGPLLPAGVSRLTGALRSDDTRRMVDALRALGVLIAEPDATTFLVRRSGPLRRPSGPLFLGNAGTAVRFLTAAAALVDGPVVLDGDADMRRRPIEPLVIALRALGVTIEAPSGCPPVTVRGQGRLAGGRVTIDGGLSSQYVSALLMAAAMAEAPVDVVLGGQDIGARGYVELTLAAMAAFGGAAERRGAGAWRVMPTGYRAADVAIEPDASSAVYLWVAEKLTGGAIDLGLSPDAFTQPDAAAFALIAAFPRLPSVIDGSQIQDAVPALAVLAAFGETVVRFTGVANLRVKECDRLSAVATELCRLKDGLAREEGDELVEVGDPDLARTARPALIRTYRDHRIAMSFALAGLRAPGVAIDDPDCVSKTWPGFWERMAELGAAMSLRDG